MSRALKLGVLGVNRKYDVPNPWWGHITNRVELQPRVLSEQPRGITMRPCQPKYPNPEPGRVRFYLLCFDGVRTIDADADALKKGTDRRSELWTESQRVLVELRFSYRVNRQETIIIWTKTVRHERNRRFAQSEMRYSSAAAPFADLLRCV